MAAKKKPKGRGDARRRVKPYRRPKKPEPVVGPVIQHACLVCGSLQLAGTTFADGSTVPLCRGHVTVLRPIFERLRDIPSPGHRAEVERLKGEAAAATRARDTARADLEAMRKARPRLREAIKELAHLARSVASLARTWTDDDEDEDP